MEIPTENSSPPIREDTESLAKLLESSSIEALQMVLMILRAQQNNTGRGT
ncbi:MAG: hypothetical protein NTZ16_11065 [Verrucomicrobia bacterium]|nr:hypothetical protein [Verrucomicrobiota bacterium]